MAPERLQRCSRDGVPEPDCLVVGARHDLLAVWREGHGSDPVCMIDIEYA